MKITFTPPKPIKQYVQERIPTRFDDIQKEILKEKFADYNALNKPTNVEKTYTLGSVIGDKLSHIR